MWHRGVSISVVAFLHTILSGLMLYIKHKVCTVFFLSNVFCLIAAKTETDYHSLKWMLSVQDSSIKHPTKNSSTSAMHSSHHVQQTWHVILVDFKPVWTDTGSSTQVAVNSFLFILVQAAVPVCSSTFIQCRLSIDPSSILYTTTVFPAQFTIAMLLSRPCHVTQYEALSFFV